MVNESARYRFRCPFRGVVGGLGYWMVQANNKMIRLLDMQTLLRESQATHFHHLNIATEGVLSDLNTLQTTLDALRATHPDIDASMAVHQFLLAYETESSPAIDIQRAQKSYGQWFNTNRLKAAFRTIFPSTTQACSDVCSPFSNIAN